MKKDLHDDHPFDTWKEIYLAWIALMLTSLVLLVILYFVTR